MTIPSADLLKLLGSVAAPGAAQGFAPLKAGALDFASMLDKARQGGLSSGRPVSVDSASRCDLTSDQLERLALAADQAEAQGATRALVLIDGQALRLDVLDRKVTGAADLSTPGVLTGVDAVVNLPKSTAVQAPPLPLPRAGFSSPSLLRALGPRPAA